LHNLRREDTANHTQQNDEGNRHIAHQTLMLVQSLAQRIVALYHERGLQQVSVQEDFLSAGGQTLPGEVLTVLGLVLLGVYGVVTAGPSKNDPL